MTDKLIERNPDILWGTPVFAGTRVPVRALMDYLEAGDTGQAQSGHQDRLANRPGKRIS